MNTVPGTEAQMGLVVEEFDALGAGPDELEHLKSQVYTRKIVVLKRQKLGPAEFVAFGRRLGEVEAYYEPMYHHPQHPEIFVSSNVNEDGRQVGVPQTGQFWHHDYSFMPRPFGLTLIHPQVVPSKRRGTYFIDMGKAYAALPEKLKAAVKDSHSVNSVRRQFKIRPGDVYRPVSAVLDEIEQRTPASAHPTVFSHPVTGESILYVSEAITEELRGPDGQALPSHLLNDLLTETGQLDSTFRHPNIHLQTFDKDDLLIWDNRSLVHRALHAGMPEPAVSFRVTVHDQHEFYPGISAHAANGADHASADHLTAGDLADQLTGDHETTDLTAGR